MASQVERGALISFEGGDGSGKGTQSRLLRDWFEAMGIPNHFDSFPRYDTPTGKKVARYLNGNPDNLGPEEAGLLYAEDRLAARPELLMHRSQGDATSLDRYYDSNKGHQGGRIAAEFRKLDFASEAEREIATIEAQLAYFKGVDDLEVGVNDLPVPDLTILFHLEPKLAQAYVAMKRGRTYTDEVMDDHEADPFHLQDANDAYRLLAESQPERFLIINPATADNERMRSREEIHHDVVLAVRPLLLDLGYRLAA